MTTMKLSERFNNSVACVVSLRELAESKEIDIPDVQRGLVWNPTQIAELWKSIFEGYPIGALTVYKQEDKWQLIDGQQRWHAIKLGLHPDEKQEAMTILWTVWEKKQDESWNFVHLMVSTRRHPWGFVWNKTDDHLERLPHPEMVETWADMLPNEERKDPFDIPTLAAAQNYFLKDNSTHKWIPLHKLLSEENTTNDDVIENIRSSEQVAAWRKRVESPFIPLIRFNLQENVKTGRNRIHELFTRINKGGTPISNTDLTYSTLCSYMGSNFKQAINNLARDFLPPSRVARLYARLKYTEDSDRKRSGLLVEPSHYSYWQNKDKNKDIVAAIVAAIDAAKRLFCDACIPASIYLSASGDEWLTVICWCMWKFPKRAGSAKDKKLLCMLPYVVCRDPGYHTHFCERFYEALNTLNETDCKSLLELIAVGVAYAACYATETGMYPLNKPEKVELKAEYPYNEEWLHIFANPRNEALLHFLQTPYMNRMLREECGFYPHEPATWGEAMNRPWDVDHIVPKSLWWKILSEEALFQESLANKQMLYYRRNREKQDAYIGVPADDGVCPACDFCYSGAVLIDDDDKYYGWEGKYVYAPRPGRLHHRHLQNNEEKYLKALNGYEEVVNRRLAEMVRRLWEELGIAQLVDTINKIPEMEEHVPDCLKLAVECWGYLDEELTDAENLKWCAIRHDESRQKEIAVKDFYHSLCSWLAVGKVENGAFRCFCWQQVDARTLKIEAGYRRLPDMTQAEWLKGAEKEGSRSAWWVEDGSFKDGIYVHGQEADLRTWWTSSNLIPGSNGFDVDPEGKVMYP